MSSYIYVYLNEKDVVLIENLLHQKGASFYDANGDEVTELAAFSVLKQEYYIGWENSCLTYSPCDTSMRIIQPAVFYLPDVCSKAEKTLFRSIKEFCVSNFKKNQWYYFGSGIYQDWLGYKYHLAWLESQRFLFKKDQLDQVWETIRKNHFIIRNNKVNVDQKEIVNLKGNSWVVFCEKAQVYPETIDIHYDTYKGEFDGIQVFEHYLKQIVEYSEKSDCVFLSKRKDCYCMSIDQRKFYERDATCIAVFHSIKQVLGLPVESGV